MEFYSPPLGPGRLWFSKEPLWLSEEPVWLSIEPFNYLQHHRTTSPTTTRSRQHLLQLDNAHAEVIIVRHSGIDSEPKMASKSARFETLRFIVELCFDGCKNAN